MGASREGTPRKFNIKPRYAVAIAIVAGMILFSSYFLLTLLLFPRVLPQQAINLLPDAAVAQQGQKVLVFTPHPDDETIAVGGYIAESIQDGADVKIVLVTDGNHHHNGVIRYDEFKKATGILGVKESNLVFLGFADGSLRRQNKTILQQQLKAQIDAYSPDIIIYPSIRDFHPDHYTTGRIINNILATGNYKVTAFQYLVHYEIYYPDPKRLATNLYLLPPVRLAGFGANWQRVLLPQNIENIKEQAINAYKTQLADPMLKDLLLANIRKNELLLAQ